MSDDTIINSPTYWFTESVNQWFGSGKTLVQLVGLNMASYYFECFDNFCPTERVHFNEPMPVVESVWKRLRESGRFYGEQKTHEIYRQGLQLFWDRLAVLREAEPAIAEIKGLGGDPRGIAKVWELAQRPDYDRWVAAHEGWLGVASEAVALVVAAYTPAAPPHGAQPQPDNAQPAGNGQDGTRKPTINTRMLELVQRDLARVSGWTAKQWAAELQCSPPAVVATPTWKDLEMARERQKAERKADRRRRKRPAKRD